ncbi:MAG: c-type cytochrome [Vicinamibacterales bacterium]
MTLPRICVVALLFAGCLVTLSAQTAHPWPPGVQQVSDSTEPRTPQEEMQTFFMAPGYRVELVASEPMVQDAVVMDWDPDGRLWLVEMAAYMTDLQATNEYEPVGRIVVLEDLNDDGKMDKRTVFADGLVLPRAIKVLDHGVLVGEPPNLWLLRDTNGDLRADTKDLVTNQYGRLGANVEHNANSLFWAMDNWMYTSEVDMYLRLKDGKFEVKRTLSRGQWGATQDDAGRIFRNTNEASLHVDLIPERYFNRYPTLLRTRGSYESLEGANREVNRVWPVRPTPGVNRGYQAGVLKSDGTLASFTSVSSPTVYRGDRLPAELYGNVFVTEPAANLVSRLLVRDDGTTLQGGKAYEGAEFMASTDERFRPVYLSNAPDGTLYILDLYRGIIQYKSFITEYLRDHIVGHKLEQPVHYSRIYRVMHETTRRDTKPALTSASPARLVATLSHPNGWRRDTAQRLLVERGARAAVPALKTLATNPRADWRARVHALWTLDGMDAIDVPTVVRALSDASRDVRVAALRVSERWFNDPTHPIQTAVLARLTDSDWAVRRQLAATLGELPRDVGLPAIATLLERSSNDPVTLDAALSGLRGSETAMLTRLLASPTETPQRVAAVTTIAATIVRGSQDTSVQTVLGWVADATRPAWQRSALLGGAEVALLGTPLPGSAATGRGAGAGAGAAAAATPAPCPTCPGARAGPGGGAAFPTGPAGGGRAGGGGRAAGAAAAAVPAGAAPPAQGRGNGPGLRVNREPALSAVAAGSDDLAARATRVLARIEWPGKPGAAAPVTPLTADEQRRFDAGHEIYANICQACHQEDGRGRSEVAPPLVGSGFALAKPDVPARILLNGKEGTVGLMPPLGSSLSDDQIAAVLTYIRREWGQAASPVAPAVITETRAASAGRTRPWTNDELTQLTSAPGAGGAQE